MAELQRLSASAEVDAINMAMQADGAVIIEDALPAATTAQVRDELLGLLNDAPYGDDFSGRQTQRIGALVARSPACRPLVMDSRVLNAAHGFLNPYTQRIILHLTQAIHIHPTQGAQPIHRDRLAWGGHIPRSIEPQFNTIWALTDFTRENGGTRVVPGSNHWPDDRRAEAHEMTQAEMSAGSILLYSGSVLHSGCKNQSATSRLGLNITYCLGWLRQEENQYLSCPPHLARELEPELQDLLGYTQGTYAIGYYSDPESDSVETRSPEFAVGREPSKRPWFPGSRETTPR